MTRTRAGRAATMLLVASLGALVPVALTVVPPAAAAPALAEETPLPHADSAADRYQVTFAARACTSYSQVMTNRVRDDRTEAATAPGRDSAYADGQAVNADVEAVGGAGCAPLAGWKFTFGGGREKKGALSTVTAPVGETAPTADQTPRLDETGHPTGKTVAGAVTVTLTDEQVRLAMRRELWVQGGSAAQQTPDKGDAFGVLRCAIDGRAGQAVQWVGFPAVTRHVFCYAYYVRGAGQAASLVVRARPARVLGYPQRFAFDYSGSYSATKGFAVSTAVDPVDTTFVRTAGAVAHRVVARPPAGWQVTDVSCVKTGAGNSAVVTDPAAGRADVTLAAGEIVTCTFGFTPPPKPAGLTLRLFSEGGPGAFGLVVNGDGGARALQATPAGDGSPVVATGADLTALTAGAYTLTLTPPAADAALWSFAGMSCDGQEIKPDGLVATVTVPAAAPLDCVLRVSRKQGRIVLNAVTVGGVASAAFAVVPSVDAGSSWSAVATTTGYGVPSAGVGTLPAEMPFGAYVVTPLAPPSTVDGAWRLGTFLCTPEDAVPERDGALTVTLTAAAPSAECTATYQFVAATRLQTVLRFQGEPAGRESAAVIEVACDDGSAGRVVLPAGDVDGQSLPEPLAFLEPTRCTLTRVATGEGDGTTVTLSAILDPAPGNAPLGLPTTIEVARDTMQYTVTITANFDAPIAAAKQAKVFDPGSLVPIALIGAGLVGIGLVILLVMVIRSRGA